MCDLKQTSDFWSLASFLAVIVGGLYALWKFRREGRRQRQILADGLYQRYLERAMDHPKISWPRNKVIPKGEPYRWLIAVMLNAHAAQIISEPSKDMREAIKADLRAHQKYLESDEFKIKDDGWKLFPPELKKLYDEEIGAAKASGDQEFQWGRLLKHFLSKNNDPEIVVLVGIILAVGGFLFIDPCGPIWGLLTTLMNGKIPIGDFKLPYPYLFATAIILIGYGMYKVRDEWRQLAQFNRQMRSTIPR